MNIRHSVLIATALLIAGCSYTAPTPAPPEKVATPVVTVPPGTTPPAPGPTASPLQVSISGVPSSIVVGTPMTFAAQSVFQTGAVSYRWTYSDGGSTAASALSASTHTFGSVGAATITVTATDTHGDASASMIASVIAAPPPTTPTAPTTPTLAVAIGCTAQPPSVVVPCNLTTNWNGETMSPGSLVSEAWEWGDGLRDAGTAMSPLGRHAYAQAGTYLIVVTITATPTPTSGIKTAQASKSIVIGG